MRNLSMKKFGTPIAAGPGKASDVVGFDERRDALVVAQDLAGRARRARALRVRRRRARPAGGLARPGALRRGGVERAVRAARRAARAWRRRRGGCGWRRRGVAVGGRGTRGRPGLRRAGEAAERLRVGRRLGGCGAAGCWRERRARRARRRAAGARRGVAAAGAARRGGGGRGRRGLAGGVAGVVGGAVAAAVGVARRRAAVSARASSWRGGVGRGRRAGASRGDLRRAARRPTRPGRAGGFSAPAPTRLLAERAGDETRCAQRDRDPRAARALHGAGGLCLHVAVGPRLVWGRSPGWAIGPAIGGWRARP